MTHRQEAFKNAYLITLATGIGNATQSAITAGYSKKTCRQIGQKLLSNVVISNAIKEFQKKERKRTENIVVNQLEYTRDLRKRCIDAGNLKAELTANDQINKMQGDYAPEKRELTVVSHAQRLKEIGSMEKTGLLTDGKVVDADFEENSDSNS